MSRVLAMRSHHLVVEAVWIDRVGANIGDGADELVSAAADGPDVVL
jgi:hypothetical protein